MTVDAVTITACRACGSEDLVEFVSLGEQPLANGLVRGDDERDDRTYPLTLVRCGGCGLVQLSVTVDPELLFREYLYTSSVSKLLLDNAADIVRRTVERDGLGADDLAMEMGSNDGYLLKGYVERGVPVLGIDPARNLAVLAEANGVPTLTEFFGSELARQLVAEGRQASVFHANNVIAHVPDIIDVLQGVALVLRPDGIAIFESPSLQAMLEHLEFDTIYHEHLFFHSLTNFSALLARAGLEVVDVEAIPVHGTSLRVTAAHPGSRPRQPIVDEVLAAEAAAGLGDLATYQRFGERVAAIRAELASMLLRLQAEGLKVAGYGAAAKCTVLLNALGEAGRVPMWVADASPHKQGLYVPGVRRPVVPPSRIAEDEPDVLVIFVWNLLEEILAQQHEYRERGGKVLVPVPEPRIV
jgi:SAM-dependent methyltransferase